MTDNTKEAKLLADEPLGKKLIRKGFWMYLFSYLVAPAGYLIKMIVSNTLSVEDVGVMYAVIGFVTLISVYNDLGLTEALYYFLPRFWVKKKFDYVKTSIFLSLGVQLLTGILIAIGLRFSAPRLAAHHFQDPSAILILRFFCLYFLGVNVFQVINTVYMAFQDTFNANLTTFIRMWTIVGGCALFFFLGQGTIVWYSMSRVAGLLVSLLVSLFIFWRKYRETMQKGKLVYHKSMIREYYKYAFWIFLGINAGVLIMQVDQQMIVNILGPEASGFYTVYLSLFNMQGVVVTPLMTLLFPVVSELIVKRQKAKIALLQNIFYTYFMVFGIALGALFLIIGPQLAEVLFGEKFSFSGSLLQVSASFVVLTVIQVISFNIMAGLGKVKERVVILGSAVLLNIILNLFLIPTIGLHGAIIATICSWILISGGSFYVINKHQRVIIDRKFVLKNIFVIFVVAGLMYFSKQHLFSFGDEYRRENMLMVALVGLLYFGILLGVNKNKILLLKQEINKMKGA